MFKNKFGGKYCFKPLRMSLCNQWNIYLAYNSQQIIMKCNAIFEMYHEGLFYIIYTKTV